MEAGRGAALCPSSHGRKRRPRLRELHSAFSSGSFSQKECKPRSGHLKRLCQYLFLLSCANLQGRGTSWWICCNATAFRAQEGLPLWQRRRVTRLTPGFWAFCLFVCFLSVCSKLGCLKGALVPRFVFCQFSQMREVCLPTFKSLSHFSTHK